MLVDRAFRKPADPKDISDLKKDVRDLKDDTKIIKQQSVEMFKVINRISDTVDQMKDRKGWWWAS